MRARTRLVVVVVTLVAIVAAVPGLRHGVLVRVGRMLTTSDAPAADADLLAVDVDSGLAGAVEVSDLYRAHPSPAVATFVLRSSPIDRTLRERRIVLPDVVADVLEQLGIPRHAIARFPVEELGTTGTTAALAAWSRANPTGRVNVVVNPTHGRRYRRALLRAWPAERPTPHVVVTPYALFRADDWWQSRTTLREGLVEIEKLMLDYVTHPWPVR